MKILNKKRFRDIMQNKMQFFNIFIMIFLGVFAFAGVHAYMDGMQKSGDAYYESNNLQDLWITGENLDNKDVEQIKDTDNVKNAEGVLTIKTELEEKDEKIILDTNFIDENNISKMYVVDGEGFDKEKKGVWFDSYLAKNLNLKVGDEITFTYQNFKLKEKILGLVNVPDHVYSVKDDTELFPTNKNYGYIYLSINEIPDEIPKTYNKIIVDVDDTNKLNETKQNIENKIDKTIGISDRSSDTSYKCYSSEIEEGQTYSFVFAFLFLFIAILSVVTTMNRFVAKQRTQIGTLKAFGFKNKKVALLYISYGFWISVFASALGILLGAGIIGKFFLNMEQEYFEIPKMNMVILPVVYIMAVLVVIVITLVTYLSCRKMLKESPVEALRIERPKVKNAKFNLTTKGILKKASISTKWNLRDISRSKGRTIMGVVGIIGCTALMLCAFGMKDTMSNYVHTEFEVINKFKYKLALSNNHTSEQLKNIEDKYGSATTETQGIEFKNSDEKVVNTITVNDSSKKVSILNHNYESIDMKDDGIYVTEKMPKKYNLKIGDEIEWHIFGDENWYKSKITGINRDPQNQQINMSRKYFESLGLKYRPDSLYTDSDLSNESKINGVDTIQNIDNLKSGAQAMLNTTNMMILILIILSAVLGIVIIYNLGILSFTEKQYQFATLKVLGFSDNRIRLIFVKQNLWISITGIIIGLPLGFLMTDYIFKSALGENYDFSAFIRPQSYLYAIIGVLLVTLFVNIHLADKLDQIDMVSSLKANE